MVPITSQQNEHNKCISRPLLRSGRLMLGISGAKLSISAMKKVKLYLRNIKTKKEDFYRNNDGRIQELLETCKRCQGVHSCRGRPMTVDRVEYLYENHIKIRIDGAH